jgi:hypothetical protein
VAGGWTHSCPHNQTVVQELPLLATGSEHLVYFDDAAKNVIKITKNGIFGDYYEIIKGRVTQFKCTPAEYLIRLRLLKKQFGFSQLPIGTTSDGQIVSRQQFVSGETPTQESVDSFLAEAGLFPVRQNCWLWKGVEIGGLEPWVGDARADNFVETAAGIIPIDLRMWQTSSLHDPENPGGSSTW